MEPSVKTYEKSTREELERRFLRAHGREREELRKQLERYGKRENADVRPAGKDAETR